MATFAKLINLGPHRQHAYINQLPHVQIHKLTRLCPAKLRLNFRVYEAYKHAFALVVAWAVGSLPTWSGQTPSGSTRS